MPDIARYILDRQHAPAVELQIGMHAWFEDTEYVLTHREATQTNRGNFRWELSNERGWLVPGKLEWTEVFEFTEYRPRWRRPYEVLKIVTRVLTREGLHVRDVVEFEKEMQGPAC